MILYVIIGSMLIGFCGGIVGSFAVLKRQGLLSDVIAHASLPGIAFVFLILQTKFLPALLLGALLSGGLAAGGIFFLINKTKINVESAMAAVLSSFFGWGIVMLTYIQHLPLAAQAGLDSFLFGQAAALLAYDVFLMAVVTFLVLLLVILFWKELSLFIFDPEFAFVAGFKRIFLESLFAVIFILAVLISLQAVGVILTAALFITPAIAAYFWTKRFKNMLVISAIFGMMSGFSGAYLSSVVADLPTGPVVVLTATAIFIFSILFSPHRGIIFKFLREVNNSFRVKVENVLVNFARDFEKGLKYCDSALFSKRLGLWMILHGWIRKKSGKYILTSSGQKKAFAILHKHRLWETYLVNKLGIEPDHVHRDAEEMEHILDEVTVEKLEETLKRYRKDPHGQKLYNKLK